LAINPWSYSNETPAWDDKKKMYEFLLASGVNTFFLAPAQIPSIANMHDDTLLKRRLYQFKNILIGFKGAKNLVLVTGFDYKLDWKMDRKTRRRILLDWFELIEKQLSLTGIKEEQVLFSPIDEVAGKKRKQ